MLEHYEIVELENKWLEYKKNTKKNRYLRQIADYIKIKPDKAIFALVCIIAICLGAISWILFSNHHDHKISFNFSNDTIPEFYDNNLTTSIKDDNVTSEKIPEKKEDYNLIPTLKLNDIDIKSSVDSGGFTLQNTKTSDYKSDTLNTRGQTKVIDDEFIDFGNAPNPPKGLKQDNINNNIPKASQKPRIKIETTNLDTVPSDLESKFNDTKDIKYSLELSEKAYKDGFYDDAIKWALISNELDKNNIKSWILFAKASYKIGHVNDALISLESLNERTSSKDIQDLLTKMKKGEFK